MQNEMFANGFPSDNYFTFQIYGLIFNKYTIIYPLEKQAKLRTYANCRADTHTSIPTNKPDFDLMRVDLQKTVLQHKFKPGLPSFSLLWMIKGVLTV